MIISLEESLRPSPPRGWEDCALEGACKAFAWSLPHADGSTGLTGLDFDLVRGPAFDIVRSRAFAG